MFLRKRNAKFLILAVLIILIYVSGFIMRNYKRDEKPLMFVVDEVLDGDTILIETGEYVRLIGIDSPEKNQSFYNESKAFLESLILSRPVILKIDTRDRDNYNRLLRYVYLNNLNINIEMVKQGYARPMHISPDISQKEKIDQAWQECLKNKVNLCQ